MAASDNETDLIRRARQGDEAAYEDFVSQHQEAVFRLAYLLLADQGEADDVAQETFIHAYKALAQFDLNRPARPWLLRIARNLAYNRNRAIKRYFAVLQRLGRADPLMRPDNSPDPSYWDSQALWESIRRLDRPDQEIIYLRYFLELSEAEAAQALGIAQGTVKSRLHRAIGRLRSILEPGGESG